MHSTQYTRVARAADSFGFSVVMAAAQPGDDGSYPSVFCVLYDDSRPFDRAFATGTCALPDARDLPVNPAFFFGGCYDLSRERAIERFVNRVALDTEFIGEIEALPDDVEVIA
jgi:hypothetical protein